MRPEMNQLKQLNKSAASNAGSGAQGRREESNQAEMIVNESGRMRNDDMNVVYCGENKHQDDDVCSFEGKTSEGEGNSWSLMQIVESAESKLMRQKRQEQVVSVAGAGELDKTAAAASCLARRSAAAKAAKTLLLKSPAFSTNTLDEDHLNKLAQNCVGEHLNITPTTTTLQCSDCGPRKLCSCKKSSTKTDMTNRRRLSSEEEASNEEMDEEDEDDETAAPAADEREEPTPTNDLIRALIHRDRLALGSFRADNCPKPQHNEPVIRERLTDWRCLHPNNDNISHCSPNSRCSSCQQQETKGARERSQAEHGSNSEEFRLLSPPGRNQRLADKCEKAQSDERDLIAVCKSNEDNDDNTVNRKRRLSVFDLSGLISKCHKLQLSPSSGANSDDCEKSSRSSSTSRVQPLAPYQQTTPPNTNRCLSPRKPSDPSDLMRAQQVAAAAAASTLSAASSQRRHSTYMLPFVLTSGNRNEDGSDDSSEDSDLVALKFASNGRKLSQDEEDLDADLPMVAGRDFNKAPLTAQLARQLPSSASSPSALSTPTNEQGGCGGQCCAPHQQENVPLARRLFNKQNYEVTRRQNRIGSNPLDHFRITNELTSHLKQFRAKQQPPPSKQQANQVENKAPPQQNKRHSIINIFSGGAHHNHHQVGPALVSRLSHPRSLFSSANSSSSSSSCNQQTCDIQQEQQYEPLIPESGFKIVVMGTSGSGKTSIIQRFMYNSFTWRHLPTVEDTYFIEFPYMKNIINISISDTSGTYQFPAMKRLAINSGDAFILVYSVDNIQSFDDLETLRQTILDERERAYLEASANSIGEQQQQQQTCHSCSSSGLATSATNSQCSMLNNGQQTINPSHQGRFCNHLQQPGSLDQQTNNRDLSPSRHWSLASLFNSAHSHGNTAAAAANHATNLNSNQTQGQHHQCPSSGVNSLSSSICSSSNCSSSDNSRRSSVSAAEAALKTRRTRYPPIVIVANKHDLPPEKHLVNSDEIEALAVIDWNNGFVRASAALDWNINEIFQQVLKQARQPPTLAEAIVSKRRKSLPPKLPHLNISNSNHNNTHNLYN